MKFTDGFWRIRKGVNPIYAIEYYDHDINNNELTIYTTSKHITHRGDLLNIGMLTINISSPINDIIKISTCHFEGVQYKGPFANIYKSQADVKINETDDFIEYISGNTKAIIDKRPNNWSISFYGGERFLTKTGYHNLACMQTSNGNYMVEQLFLDSNETIYGFGEKFTNFIKNGQSVDTWNSDGGTTSEQAYKSIPFYITNKGYGALVDNEGDVSFEVGSEKVEFVQFSFQGERQDYYLINGSTPKGVIEKYTDLTGKPALPPVWSFGLWLSTSFTTNYDEKTTLSFINGMKERNIPVHVFHFDCYWMKGCQWCDFEWDNDVFPDPKNMIKKFHDLGIKVCVWINPYIAQKSKLFKEGKDYFVKKNNGDIWQTDLWQSGMAIVDFTNPEAVKWYQSKLKALLDMGGFEETAPAHVYKRWCAFGLLSSHSRLHGSKSYRVPWAYDDEACDVLSKFSKLKCRLMPYLYSQAKQTHLTGVPMLRPMFIEFNNDRTCAYLDKQYMLGDNLLIAPVFKENGEVEYYLRQDKWINLLTNKLYTGGSWQKEIFNIDELPIIVRPNSILVMGNNDERVVYDYANDSKIYLSYFEDNALATTTIIDSTDQNIVTITAERIGNTIYISGINNIENCLLLNNDQNLSIKLK